MFSTHDRVSWIEVVGFNDYIGAFNVNVELTGTIVSEEPHDHYLVKRDSDGKCQKLCYRKLRLIDEGSNIRYRF